MLRILTSSWWAMTLRGIMLIILGILAFTNPAGTALAFIFYASLLIITEGVIILISAFMGFSSGETRWHLLVEAALTILFGILLYRASGVLIAGIAYLFGGWMIVSGIIKVGMAIQLRQEIENEFWLGLAGVLGVLLGGYILFYPEIGIATLMAIAGIFAILTGLLLIALSLRLRKVQGRIHNAVDNVRGAVTNLSQEVHERQGKP
jgi:uncharacterized membrane protein HdeD (DUF308 family)